MTSVRRFAVGARPAPLAWLTAACLCLLLQCQAAPATPVDLAGAVPGPLGASMSLLEEYGPPLSIDEAIQRRGQDAFRPNTQPVPD